MARVIDMMEEAERIIALSDEERTEAWIEDQHRAAGDELEPDMEAIAEGMGKAVTHGTGLTVHEVAFRLAVVEAVRRRTKPERTCEHARTLTPPPLIVDLANGSMRCKPCLARWLEENTLIVLEDDGRCDMCEDGPYTSFWPMYVAIGPMLVTASVCDRCRAEGPIE